MTAYHISLVNIQTNYCNDNQLILDLKQGNKIMKLYYFYTLKALWNSQGKINMYYFLTNGIKRLQSSKKCDEMFEYFKK